MQLDNIALPADLLSINEFDWNPVAQNTEHSLSGASFAQEGQLSHGRYCTLWQWQGGLGIAADG